MNTLSLAARLFSAATAATITFALLSAVFSIAEPQRSMLIAKTQHSEPQQQSSTIALVMVSTAATGHAGK